MASFWFLVLFLMMQVTFFQIFWSSVAFFIIFFQLKKNYLIFIIIIHFCDASGLKLSFAFVSKFGLRF